jgi:hypothetical protein
VTEDARRLSKAYAAAMHTSRFYLTDFDTFLPVSPPMSGRKIGTVWRIVHGCTKVDTTVVRSTVYSRKTGDRNLGAAQY